MSGRANKKPNRKPVGVEWRIGAGGIHKQPKFAIRSADYPGGGEMTASGPVVAKRTTFDELWIRLSEKGGIHLESMDSRTYFLCIGEERRMIHVKRDGEISVGDVYY